MTSNWQTLVFTCTAWQKAVNREGWRRVMGTATLQEGIRQEKRRRMRLDRAPAQLPTGLTFYRIFCRCTGESREWHVSDLGADNVTCGTTPQSACRRLNSAVSSANNGDVLRLDPAPRPYRLPCVQPFNHSEQDNFSLQSLTIAAAVNRFVPWFFRR